MHEIFISYSHANKDWTARLAAQLEARLGPGTVWWDTYLEARAGFEAQITTALRNAKAVVVVWSEAATQSKFVYVEAMDADHDGKLVNVCGDDIAYRDIPKPFGANHVDDLGDLDKIVDTVVKVINRVPLAARLSLAEMYARKHGRPILDAKQLRLPTEPEKLGRVAPSELLQAKYAVVPFDRSTGMLDAMLAWARDPESTQGRLIHGAGGLGKTRLAIEVAARLRDDHGWQAGFLDRPPDDADTVKERWRALDQMITRGDDSGLLIVMDYAEARRDELRQLAARLAERPETDTRPVRVLLLTRNADHWWKEITEEDEHVARLFRGAKDRPAAMPMPAFATGAARLAYFVESATALAPAMEAQGYAMPAAQASVQRLARIESGERYARPLAIQMEAMLWLASSSPEEAEQGVDKLLGRILGLERAHWEKLLEPRDAAGRRLRTLDTEARRAIGRGLAQATAVQGIDGKNAAYRLLLADGFYSTRKAYADVAPVHDDLVTVYGKADGGVAHLEPDLIGEHHVATSADTALLDACLAWIDGEPADQRAKRRQDLVTVVQRATQAEHGADAIARATRLIDHLVAKHTATLAAAMIPVMIETQGALLQRLEAALPRFDEGALDALDAAMPHQTFTLADLAFAVTEQLVAHSRTRGDDAAVKGGIDSRPLAEADIDTLSRLSGRLNNYGLRLGDTGRREAALEATLEAVALRRRLAAARPDAFEPDLAMSLNNLGIRHDALGDREAALAATLEAVAIRRRLAAARPDAFNSDLANSLWSLARVLAGMGRHADAADAGHESLTRHAPLVERYPAAFRGKAATIAAEYIAKCEAAAREPDAALLERIAKALSPRG